MNLGHDGRDVRLERLVCRRVQIETILFDEFEIVCRVNVPLVQDANRSLSALLEQNEDKGSKLVDAVFEKFRHLFR